MPIDVHAHYVPPQLIAAIKSKGNDIGVRLAPADGGKEALRLRLRLQGAAVLPAPGRAGGRAAQMDGRTEDRPSDRRHLAGHLRLWPAARRTASPGTACSTTRWRNGPRTTRKRFSWISSVPLTDAEAAAAELERSADIGAIGVIISANIEDVNLGEFPLDPFWRKAEALGLPVLIHPVNVGACRRAPRNSRSPRSRSTPTTPRSASARC